MRFIIVAHSWHVTSNGFTVKQIDVASEMEAAGEAKKMQDAYGSFYRSDSRIIKIDDGETMLPRKLTMKERIFGRID